jgi:transposase
MSSTHPIVGEVGEEVNLKVLIGVDPHKASSTAAVLDRHGRLVEQARFATNRAGLRALERFGKRFPERRWAVESASGLGRSVAQRLVESGEDVVDVPAKLSARVRLLSVGNERKNDGLDAAYVALAAHQGTGLTEVAEEDYATVLRMLSDRRDNLVTERTRTINRLHVLLRNLVPGGAAKQLSADKAATLLGAVRPASAPGRARRQLARDLVADVRALDRRLVELDRRIRAGVKESNTSLTKIFGVGPIAAAKIVGHVGTVSRFPAKAHFASYTGTAPIEASSGDVVRHRLSRVGNRKLNHALHMIAIVQIRHDTEGRRYYRRKLAEGKSDKEALRCLKRRISDVIFKQLYADLVKELSVVA